MSKSSELIQHEKELLDWFKNTPPKELSNEMLKAMDEVDKDLFKEVL